MRYILYRSRANNRQFQLDDLDILRTALRCNPILGITGFLVRTTDHYFQEIEGPRANVLSLIAAIQADRRHSEFQVLDAGKRAARDFASWDMGYAFAVSDQIGALRLDAYSTADEVKACLRHESRRRAACAPDAALAETTMGS